MVTQAEAVNHLKDGRVCKWREGEMRECIIACVCACACYMQCNPVIISRLIFGGMSDTSYIFGSTACRLRKLFAMLLLSSIKH